MSPDCYELDVNEVIQCIGKLDDEEVKRLYKTVNYEARARSVLEGKEDAAEAALETAEGDLMARRRKAEQILESDVGSTPPYDVEQYYGSLTCLHYKEDNRIAVKDVDGELADQIDTEALPQEDPERIEMLQALLDSLHLSTLSRL